MNKKTASKKRLIKPRRMHEELVDMLLEDIQSGQLEIGESLPSEREMMAEFGVSRVTVREAVSSLEQAGFVETRAGTRAKVSRPSADSLLDQLSLSASFYLTQPDGIKSLYEVRKLIEVGTIRVAAEKANTKQLNELTAILKKNKDSIGDKKLFSESDIEFHYAIAKIIDNPIINSFYKAVRGWLEDVRTVTLAHDSQIEIAFQSHQKIHDAMKNKDPELAAKEMEWHLSQVYEIYFKDKEQQQNSNK